MVRPACVNAPQFPLQLLLQKHPEWKNKPTAVVNEDKPLGRVISVNRNAQEFGIEPGMRFASALALCSVLQAAMVPPETLEAGIQRILEILESFSPEVEPCSFEPGLFWVNASGLETLYGSIDNWAAELVAAFERADMFVSVVLGFSRFGTYACSKRRPQIQIFKTPQEEQQCADASPIDTLPFPPTVYQRLTHLGIRTVGSFANLSQGSIIKRFGKEIVSIHSFVTGARAIPLQPISSKKPLQFQLVLQTAESDLERLVLQIQELLDKINETLPPSMLIHQLDLNLVTEDREEIKSTIQPAKPTRRKPLLVKLITLRMQNTTIPAAVWKIALTAEAVQRGRNQAVLFQEVADRDTEEADHAFALIRAELGNHSISYVELCEEHLPEAQYHFQPMYRLSPLCEQAVEWRTSRHGTRRTLVRRVFSHPRPASHVLGNTGTKAFHSVLQRQKDSPELSRSFVVTSAWWQSQVDREYYFVQTASHRLLWTYFDRLENRWMIQGWLD